MNSGEGVEPATTVANPNDITAGGGANNCPKCGSASSNCGTCGGAGSSCPKCGPSSGQMASHAPIGWVYAIGRIVPQFPNLGVEKEFRQTAGGAGTADGLLETNRLIDMLSRPENKYLARQLCWIFHNGEAESFTLVCRNDMEAQRLVDALPRAESVDQTIQVVIGSMGYSPFDAPCAGTALPAVMVDQHLTFPMSDFIDALAVADQGSGEKDGKGKGAKPDEAFRVAARDLFARLTRRSDNRGMTDEHRALNYVALRYPPMYRLASDAQHNEKSLVDVQVRRGPTGARRLIAVRMVFRAHRTDVVERYQCLVDVTDRFPFLAAPLTQVFD
jgi:hypothetical protein